MSATQPRYTSEVKRVAKGPGLVRRGSAYSYRRRVPNELVSAIGRTELWVALRTTDYRKATVEARKAATRVDELFAEARRALVDGTPFEMPAPQKVAPSDADLVHAVALELWRDEQVASRAPQVPDGMEDADWGDELETAIASFSANDANAGPALMAIATQLIQEHRLPIVIPALAKSADGIALRDQPPVIASHEFMRLQELVRRAEIEKRLRALERAKGGHGDRAHDPLFEQVRSFSQPPARIGGTVTLGEAIERFENDPTRAHFTQSAAKKYVLTFRALKEVVGAEMPIAAVSRGNCAATQELLAGLPPNFSKKKAFAKLKNLKAVVDLAAESGSKRMSVGTVRVYTHTQASFFNWTITKGMRSDNPATRLAPAKSVKRHWNGTPDRRAIGTPLRCD